MCFFEVAKITIIYYMCSLWHLSRPDFCLEGGVFLRAFAENNGVAISLTRFNTI